MILNRKYFNLSTLWGAARALDAILLFCILFFCFSPLANAQFFGPIYNPAILGFPVGAATGSTVTLNSNADLIFSAQDTSRLQLTGNTLLPSVTGTIDLGSPTKEWKRIYFDFTNTATIGAVTINKSAGRVRMAAGVGSFVVTNSNVTAASHVFCNVFTNDATATSCRVTAAAGSFTMRTNANATATTDIDFFVVNSD